MSKKSAQKEAEIKEQVFIEEYLLCFNGAEAARRAGYSKNYARKIAQQILKKEHIAAQIKERLDEIHLQADEALKILSDHARGDVIQFFEPDGSIDVENIKKSGKSHVIKRVKIKRMPTKYGDGTEYELEVYNSQDAIEKIAKLRGIGNGENSAPKTSGEFYLPAELIAPAFLNVYRDLREEKHTEYVLYGGRGSTKSSFISLALIMQLINHPTMHALAIRQVAVTLRDSVYAQLQWAIGELGLSDQFKTITNPLEIEYLPTGQKIYFRGADEPAKIKSIKPKFGYIGLLWFEELDQLHGQEAVRKIEQSAIRGGDRAFVFKSFNPPQSVANWVNKYLLVPKATQYQHRSDYRSVPVEWLGKPFLDEAEHLQNVNLKVYEHEYLGLANGTGGQVFSYVVTRKITDDEIQKFDRVYHGLDFGFFPDPAHYSRSHYDAARMTLYIFGELRRWKTSNRDLYDDLVKYGLQSDDLLICDSAEPKSVADFATYGANARGAEKGPASVKYSMKWLQSLKEIVIDNERCHFTADEFLSYEFERTKDGEIISEYPDKNNHAIDSVRYGTNILWKNRGE